MDKQSTGRAGEALAESKLWRAGFSNVINLNTTKKNALDYDLQAYNENYEVFWFQVKTFNKHKKGEFMVTRKIETYVPLKNSFFIFVDLSDNDNCYVVPLTEVQRIAHENHIEWLNTPGKHGQAHNDNYMRSFVLERCSDGTGDMYKNNWNF